MASQAVVTQGTLFQVGTSSTNPNVFATVSEVRGFRGLGGGDSPVIDVTSFDSTKREKRLGMADEGTLSIDLNFIPGDPQQILLEALRAARTPRGFKITMADGTIITFEGLVKKFEKTAGTDDVWRGSVDLEVSGEAVYTPAP